MIELLEKRDHYCKHFSKGNGEFVCRQSLGLAHYFDGTEFKDIEHISFPEGKEIKSDKDLKMVAIPAWATCEISKDGKSALFVDKKGVAIQEFRKAFICHKDVEPHTIVDKDGKSTELKGKDLIVGSQNLDLSKDEKIVVDESKITEAKFAVKNGSLVFELPVGVEAKDLKAFDDTDTGSTDNKNSYLTSWNTTFVGGGGINGTVARRSYPGHSRSVLNFTMSSGSGTISAVKLYLKSLGVYTAAGTTEAHQLTGTGGANWTESGACWAYYTGSSAWATAGGDFSATVIHSITDPTAENWGALILLGTGSTNPLSLTWGSTVNLLLKQNDETGTEHGWAPYFRGADAGNRPYIEITYAAAATTNASFLLLMVQLKYMTKNQEPLIINRREFK